MPVAAAAITVLPLDSVKMDERKRPATDDLGSTPPLKRQAVALNGSSSHVDTDLPWNEDINRYQKDAILRQMREYKREKNVLEQQLVALNKRAEFHDDHIRQVDLWFSQLLDEVAVLSNATNQLPSDQIAHPNSSLLSSTNKKFATFLQERSETINATLAQLLAKAPASAPDVLELQERLTNLLATQKSHIPELERIKVDKDQLQERLESAVSRYMLAEKKLDRARSAQVAKLEAQATASSRPEGSRDQEAPVVASEDGIGGAASEAARKEAVAVAEKRTEQLEKLVKENVKLTNDLNALQLKLAGLSDEDYANSELFKTLKSQHEDVIKRLNDLEAINSQLREEAKLLHGERTAYREEADNELRSATIDMQSQLAQTEAEMLRVKHKRDEVIAELGIHKSTQDQHKASTDQTRELAEAREIRITALESESERIRARESSTVVDEQISALDHETLKQRLSLAEHEKRSLENELRSMEAAWKKTSVLANKKIADIIDVEDKVSKFSAEKGKADQKYFASMKNNEAMKAEVKALRAQDQKSSEIVSQLKEAESSCRGLLMNLEKQLAEVKDALASVTNQHRAAQKRLSEQKVSTDRLTAQTTELNKKLAAKDASVQEAAKAQREAEVELTELKLRLERSEKSLASWKKKGIGNQNEEFEMLRTLAQCNVCHSNWKNTVIKTCGHVCCQECVDKQIQLRSRKCPLCGRVFGTSDHMRITL